MTVDKSVVEADDDIFEISDFTVVTHLEGLIASLESTFNSIKGTWLVENNNDNECRDEESEFIKRKKEVKSLYCRSGELLLNYFYDSRGIVSVEEKIDKRDKRHIPVLSHVCPSAREMTTFERDFCEASSIARQFGVSSYILISPANFVIDENQLQTFMSAIEVALLNAEFELPVFIQFGPSEFNLYAGVCKNRNASTQFDSARLRKPMNKHKFFNGIFQMFTEKAGVDLPDNAYTSIKFDFVHNKASSSPNTIAEQEQENYHEQEVTDKDGCREEQYSIDLQVKDIFDIEYPFGSKFDPFKELRLSTCWLNISTGVVNESSEYSDLDPLSAPKWFVSVAFHHDVKYLLSSMLDDLLCCRESSCSSCTLCSFADKWMGEVEFSPASAFDAITINFSATQLKFFSQPTDEDAAQHNKAHYHYVNRCLDECIKRVNEASDSLSITCDGSAKNTENDYLSLKKSANDILRFVKAAPSNSLTSCVAKALVTAFLYDDKELDKFACLWLKFVKYLRNSWETCTELPGLLVEKNRQLDLSQCLFHQKLQMINVCIRTKSDRHFTLDSKCLEEDNADAEVKGEDEDDSFYDANETFDSELPSSSAANAKPVGRDRMLSSSDFLLNYPNDRPIYVPLTQDFGPMTEDMVDKHTNYLSSLDAESGERTRAQVDILLSDMQAFKAANPGSVLEDFIRWHSPRDFSSNYEDGKGVLSDRMRQENSIWLETWRNAQAIPVSQQIRLFNETKEVETILQHFEQLTVRDLIDLLLPVIILDSLKLLVEKCVLCPLLVKDRLLALCKWVSKCSRVWTFDDFYEIKKEFEAVEVLISRFQSLHNFLTKNKRGDNSDDVEQEEARLDEFIEQLLTTGETDTDVLRRTTTNRVKVIDAPRGTLARTIIDSMKDSDNPSCPPKLPPLLRKQYIIRLTNPRPSTTSRQVPQRLYVSVANTDEKTPSGAIDYHMSGAFTSDVTFK